MRIVRWAPKARSAYLRYLRDLSELSPPAAVRAEVTVERIVDMLEASPHRGRRSLRWPKYYEWSLTAQQKLLVYQGDDEMLHVMAFYDTRQDLSVVSPEAG